MSRDRSLLKSKLLLRGIDDNTAVLMLLLSPLMVTFFEIYVACHYGISWRVYSSNIAAIFFGIPAAILLGRVEESFQKYIAALSCLGLGLMILSLWSSGISNIHRWISIDGLYFNISMIIAPFILYAMNYLSKTKNYSSILLAISMSMIYVMQPDASQSISFGVSAIIILYNVSIIAIEIRVISIICILISICLAWCQPDTLPAVEHVEHILVLAGKMGIIGCVGVGLSIIVIIIPSLYLFYYRGVSHDQCLLATAFLIYLSLQFCVVEFGNYPVPIVGAGASSILGYYAMIGLLGVLQPGYIEKRKMGSGSEESTVVSRFACGGNHIT